MAFTIADKYYIKALDEYPFNLEDAMDNLSYALSNNPQHSGANLLMGRIYQEQLLNFEKAEQYYQIAIASDTENSIIFLEYAELLIRNKASEKAKKLLEYAEKLKGTDLANLFRLKGLSAEYSKEFKSAVDWYSKATIEACFDEQVSSIEKQIKRVNNKQKLSRAKKKVKKKKK